MRKILFLLALLFLAVPATGQVSFNSLDPVADSIVCAKMRAKMDRIREHRPTVALVLSGGGAKGAAHVGVLKFLDQAGIPIDMVLGTSMGGLVGGLYSIGYDSKFLDSLFKSVDWNLILSDRIPQEFISYQQKKYKEKYIVSIPFLYSSEGFMRRRGGEDVDASGALDLGADSELGEKTLKENIFGSLPAGYIFGHNVNNIFSSLTVGYQDDIDFTELPIPFFCVASEMVSGKAYLWHHGKLNTALRSTMSIPGIFAPVRTGGMILVDGGTRNNFPTDIAREMGADIIIGVELSDTDMTYSDINNVADLVWQFIDILGRDAFVKNVNIPDIMIKPDLGGFNMMSFDSQSIDVIINRGYEGAFSKAEDLLALKEVLGPEGLQLQNTPAVDVGEIPITISGIQYSGMSPSEMSYISGKLHFKSGDKVYKKDLENAVAKIYATKSFEFVNYELLKDGDSFILNIICKKGPVHLVGAGARFDSESLVSAIFNLGFNVRKVEGSALDLTAKVASNPYLNVKYTYKMAKMPTLNIESHNAYTDVNMFDFGEAPRLNTKYWRFTQMAYFSDMNWRRQDLKLGVRNDFFNITSLLSENFIPEEIDSEIRKNDIFSLFLDARNDNMDDGYFPSSGHNAGVSYDYCISGVGEESRAFHIVQFDLGTVIPMGRVVSLIPRLNGRFIFGDNIPLTHMNIIGGSLAGRYVEQQIPFIGVNYATPMSNMLMMARADLRFRITRNNYISMIVNAVKDSDRLDRNLFLHGDTPLGYGIEYAYDSVIGPIRFNLHYSNITNKVGAYFSMGFDF